jgi:hypothetical protein
VEVFKFKRTLLPRLVRLPSLVGRNTARFTWLVAVLVVVVVGVVLRLLRVLVVVRLVLLGT